MKKHKVRFLTIFFSVWLLIHTVSASTLLVPVGQLIGIDVRNQQVCVAGFQSSQCAGQKAGLQVGDVLLQINGSPVGCAEDVRQILGRSDGTVSVLVQRGDRQLPLQLHPQITSEGPRLGVFLKESITGVGTVTWYDPQTGTFGALGHGVNDQEQTLVEMTEGSAYLASVVSVKKGLSGNPGQLIGHIESEAPIGTLTKNTPQGIFGSTTNSFSGQELPIAQVSEIHKGPASILSTIEGSTTREYSVEILKIYPTSTASGRNMLLRITDPVLLETTGGIVQGMSGSPIIQDGKLVGAVTHVLVNDPTTGYGIFIENMLDAVA